MPQADSIDITNPPISRQIVEAQIDLLIDLLDTFEPDPDAEPSLGFTQQNEQGSQAGPDYAGNANAGDDREIQHDDWLDEDLEPSLGWTEEGRLGHPNSWDSDREESVGPVRKPRPKSKTGGDVFRGTAVLGLKEPPKNPRNVPMPVRKKGAAR